MEEGKDKNNTTEKGLFSNMMHGYPPHGGYGSPPQGYPPPGVPYPPPGAYPPPPQYGYPQPGGYPPHGGYPPVGYPVVCSDLFMSSLLHNLFQATGVAMEDMATAAGTWAMEAAMAAAAMLSGTTTEATATAIMVMEAMATDTTAGDVRFVGEDIPIDYKGFCVDFVNLKMMCRLSHGCAYRDRLCTRVFIKLAPSEQWEEATMVMGTHPVARGDTLRQGTRRRREVTPHSKDTRLHLELTHLHLGHTLQHLGLTLLHLEREALMGRRGSSPTSCTALLVLMVVVMGTRLVVMGTHLVAMDTLHNKGTLLSMATPRSSMATLHSSMAIPLPATLAHPVTVVAMEEEAWAWAACWLEAQQPPAAPPAPISHGSHGGGGHRMGGMMGGHGGYGGGYGHHGGKFKHGKHGHGKFKHGKHGMFGGGGKFKKWK
ncbi:hypothetical protein TRIUR3_16979 [Triticum urartu]|uniref:Glycine-rich protein A3 n=1 Tax=Triticum urartu TaxID=4572 RepID=M7ZYH4_TRIUA|nr:hypothetical protein TRIUR3_16979 [Triticum urartu]